MTFVDRSLKQQLINKYGNEQVYVVPYDSVSNVPDKFSKSDDNLEALKKYDLMGKYIFRYDAEYNPAFQQLIPYVLVTNTTGTKYYVSKRIAGDQRLVKNYSIGFGGHIDVVDGSNNIILKGLERELHEELDIEILRDSLEFFGYVRDLSSETSEHLGFVFTVKAKSMKAVSIREKENLVGTWMTLDELVDNYFLFENWSKYIIDYLYEQHNNKN